MFCGSCSSGGFVCEVLHGSPLLSVSVSPLGSAGRTQAPWQITGKGRQVMAVAGDGGSGSRLWIALKRLDLNEDKITVVKDVWIFQGSDSPAVKQVLSDLFGLKDTALVFKLRNSQGSLVPINNTLTTNSKHLPYTLEVVMVFQHVVPKPRTSAMIMNVSLKNRLQSIMRRIGRLEEHIPEIKIKWQEKLQEEIKILSQKLNFLNQRMQIADSHNWKGMFKRPPLW